MEDRDVGAVRSWLAGVLGEDRPLVVERLDGGRSNLSHRVRYGDERFVLRRPPLGAVLDGAHDVIREYRLVEALQGHGVPLARPVAACEDLGVIGAPFTLVEFLDGAALRTAEDAAALTPAARAEVARSFGSTLARLHAIDPVLSGRPAEKGLDHARRQLHVWTRQLGAEPRRPLPALDALGAHLGRCVPEQRGVAVVHGDYRLDNVLLDDAGRVVAVLDWELWTLGDPVLDLGSTLAYWAGSRHELFPLGTSPTADGLLGTRDDVLAAYVATAGRDVDEAALAWAVSFGFWRFAVILEGVHRRNLVGAYGEAATDDWRRLEHVVPAMAEIGWQLRPPA